MIDVCVADVRKRDTAPSARKEGGGATAASLREEGGGATAASLGEGAGNGGTAVSLKEEEGGATAASLGEGAGSGGTATSLGEEGSGSTVASLREEGSGSTAVSPEEERSGGTTAFSGVEGGGRTPGEESRGGGGSATAVWAGVDFETFEFQRMADEMFAKARAEREKDETFLLQRARMVRCSGGAIAELRGQGDAPEWDLCPRETGHTHKHTTRTTPQTTTLGLL